MEIYIFYNEVIKLWNVDGEFFQRKSNAIQNAKYRAEGHDAVIMVFKRNGDFDRQINVEAAA